MRPLVALVLLATLAVAAPVPKAVKKKADDAEVIVGTWGPAEGRTEWFEFSADGGMKAFSTGGTAANGVAYKWTLDETASPKRMTWTQGSNWDCIYELDGDTLRINYVSKGQPLPDAITPNMKSVFYCDLRRVTPK